MGAPPQGGGTRRGGPEARPPSYAPGKKTKRKGEEKIRRIEERRK